MKTGYSFCRSPGHGKCLHFREELHTIDERSKTAASGGVAQLGERLNGIQEVKGSIPSVSMEYRRPGSRRELQDPGVFAKGKECFSCMRERSADRLLTRS